MGRAIPSAQLHCEGDLHCRTPHSDPPHINGLRGGALRTPCWHLQYVHKFAQDLLARLAHRVPTEELQGVLDDLLKQQGSGPLPFAPAGPAAPADVDHPARAQKQRDVSPTAPAATLDHNKSGPITAATVAAPSDAPAGAAETQLPPQVPPTAPAPADPSGAKPQAPAVAFSLKHDCL